MFRTPIRLSPSPYPIGLQDRIVAMGSCFADFMGARLEEHKFKVVINPFGVIYHPLALFRTIEMAMLGTLPEEESYLEQQDVHYNYHFHGRMSHPSRAALERLVEQQVKNVRGWLRQLDVLILTLGTAQQYVHRKTGMMVANCHKVPQTEFDKSRTSVESIVSGFEGMMALWETAPSKILLSVSPVRHLKEGLTANSASKATLRVACEEIMGRFPQVTYFPGFEIMIDDLRDYGFCARDMMHPNETAQDYIWDLFVAHYVDEAGRKFIKDWQKIMRNLKHKPFHAETQAYRDFLEDTLDMIHQLPPDVDTSREVMHIKAQLS